MSSGAAEDGCRASVTLGLLGTEGSVAAAILGEAGAADADADASPDGGVGDGAMNDGCAESADIARAIASSSSSVMGAAWGFCRTILIVTQET